MNINEELKERLLRLKNGLEQEHAEKGLRGARVRIAFTDYQFIQKPDFLEDQLVHYIVAHVEGILGQTQESKPVVHGLDKLPENLKTVFFIREIAVQTLPGRKGHYLLPAPRE